MPTNDAYATLSHVNSTRDFVGGMGGDKPPAIPALLNDLRADTVAVPQVGYNHLQDTIDEIFNGGALRTWGVGDTNELTATGTLLTVPKDSVWLVKGVVTLTEDLTLDLPVVGTHYVYLQWNGTTPTLVSNTTGVRPTTVPAICIAVVTSDGTDLEIDQGNIDYVDMVASAIPRKYAEWVAMSPTFSAGDGDSMPDAATATVILDTTAANASYIDIAWGFTFDASATGDAPLEIYRSYDGGTSYETTAVHSFAEGVSAGDAVALFRRIATHEVFKFILTNSSGMAITTVWLKWQAISG